jgi:hypothetical protein
MNELYRDIFHHDKRREDIEMNKSVPKVMA